MTVYSFNDGKMQVSDSFTQAKTGRKSGEDFKEETPQEEEGGGRDEGRGEERKGRRREKGIC